MGEDVVKLMAEASLEAAPQGKKRTSAAEAAIQI